MPSSEIQYVSLTKLLRIQFRFQNVFTVQAYMLYTAQLARVYIHSLLQLIAGISVFPYMLVKPFRRVGDKLGRHERQVREVINSATEFESIVAV